MTARPASSDVLWQYVFSQVDAKITHYLPRGRAADRIDEVATQKAIHEVVNALIRKFTAASAGQASL